VQRQSSLAFDTIYAKAAQIRESSRLTRASSRPVAKAGCDFIEDCHRPSRSNSAARQQPRSIIAPTEIYDYLRCSLRTSAAHCPRAACPSHQSTSEIVDKILACAKTRSCCSRRRAPPERRVPDCSSGSARGLCARARDGEIAELVKTLPHQARQRIHNLEAVVDRLVIDDKARCLGDSMETACAGGRRDVHVASIARSDAKSGRLPLRRARRQQKTEWIETLIPTRLLAGPQELDRPPQAFFLQRSRGACRLSRSGQKMILTSTWWCRTWTCRWRAPSSRAAAGKRMNIYYSHAALRGAHFNVDSPRRGKICLRFQKVLLSARC